MLLGRDDEQHAIVLVLLPELPLPEQRIGVGLDLVAAEIVDGGDDELDGRFLFEIGKLGLKARLRCRREHMRVVDDAPRQRRKRRRRERDAEREPRQQNKREAAQNFTFGAVAASALAVNSAIGLLPE